MMRKDYINWDEYFMGLAMFAAQRSKDPSTQVGACIVTPENKIVSIGYNGMPIGCSDNHLPWEREAENPIDTKYMYVVHAEENAIYNAKSDLTNCICYVTLFPCNECAKAIIQTGIKKIVYLSDKYNGTDGNKAAKLMFDMAKVKYEQYKPSGKTINLNL